MKSINRKVSRFSIMNSNSHVDMMSTQNTEPSAPKPARAVVNPAGIPESMKARGQWVLWKYEWRVSRNGGKWTKPPYSLSGYSASTTKPNTWTTFQKAFAAYESSTEFDGIGYVFAEGDGLAGVDLDHCMAIDGNGKRGFAGPGAAIAREIFTRFKGKAYIEYSPSGDGLHIIVKGSLERSGKGKDGLNWIEAYDHTSPRYFTFTGDVSKSTGGEPGDGQAELDWLYEAYLKRPEAVVVPIRPAPAATVADDEDILIRARLAGGSGPKFVAMFDEGLTADRENITDQSADDLALCNLLAFWTDRNPDQMDRLFRQSALMRDKWDAMRGGRTYGQMTITKAIDGCRQTIKDLDAERGAGSGSGARGSASGDGWLGGVVNSPMGIGGEAEESGRSTDPSREAIFEEALDIPRPDWTKTLEKDFANRLDMSLPVFREEIKDRRARGSGTGTSGKSAGSESDTPVGPAKVEEIVRDMNKHYCLAWCGGDLNIMKLSDAGDYIPTDKVSLDRWFQNKPVFVRNPDGDLVPVNPVNVWMKARNRREYAGVDFAPGVELPHDRLNLWGGWAVEPMSGGVEPFLELTNAVCGGNEALVEWALDWAAHMFQKPMQLPGKALLFRSGQGWGKNTWIDTLKIPVGKSFLQVNSQKHLVGDFNAHLADKLFVHAAESVWGGDKGKVGNVKALITDVDQAVEHKGRDVYSVRNYKRIILSSNERWPVPMDADDRRFIVANCLKKWHDSDKFWVDYRKWRDSDGAAKVFGFLLGRDIAGFKPWERVAENTDGWDIKLQSADALTKWWYAKLCGSGELKDIFQSYGLYSYDTAMLGEWDGGTTLGKGYSIALSRNFFWEGFEEWVRRSGTRNAPEVMHRKGILKGLCPSMQEAQVAKLNRKPCFTFPSLKQCRDEFAKAIGGDAGLMFEESVLAEAEL